MRYLIVIEETATGFSAYAPDVDGCVATGRDRPEVERHMQAAMESHVEALRTDGCDVPRPSSASAYVDVSA
jgi:predicted RNase H-like HicB family nuclease